MRRLTELEGAVLTEIAHRGNRTAFKVRRAFQLSPSVDWSGSAGAVYPAIRRMIAAGLILAEPLPGGRKTRLLSLSAEGAAALDAWSCDASAACALSYDPFRLRSGLWRTLPARRRKQVADALRANLIAAIEALRSRQRSDPIDVDQTDLALRLQRMRLAWLDSGESRDGD